MAVTTSVYFSCHCLVDTKTLEMAMGEGETDGNCQQLLILCSARQTEADRNRQMDSQSLSLSVVSVSVTVLVFCLSVCCLSVRLSLCLPLVSIWPVVTRSVWWPDNVTTSNTVPLILLWQLMCLGTIRVKAMRGETEMEGSVVMSLYETVNMRRRQAALSEW